MEKSNECKKIKILLPALIETKEQEIMTEECRKSLVSFEHCTKLTIDTNKYPTKVAGVWNVFLDQWRGKEFDYLLITANDTIADPLAIDYMVRCAEENPNAAIITGKVTRSKDDFKKYFGQYKYTSRLTKGFIDPACFLIRKGVIERIGRIDEEFPCEFVERDYINRCKLAGYDVIQPDIHLWYHPPYAGTIGNDQDRLQLALRKYLQKWGGDATIEKFGHPYNDVSLDFTYCRK